MDDAEKAISLMRRAVQLFLGVGYDSQLVRDIFEQLLLNESMQYQLGHRPKGGKGE